MMIAVLIALFSSFSAAGVSLRQIAQIPAAVAASHDGTLAAAANESSINVWRLQDRRQIHRIPHPRIAKRDDKDYVTFLVEDFSPDDRFLLMTSEHQRFGDKAEEAIYLVDLEKETMRQIYITRRPCFNIHGGFQPWICPSESASFSPDGKRILIRSHDYLDVGGAEGPERYEDEALVVDSNGSILERYKEVFRQNAPLEGPKPAPVAESSPNGARYSGFGADGHLLGIVADESACEVRDLTAGARVSFLEDCTGAEQLRFLAPDAIEVSWQDCSKDCVARYWNARSGKAQKLAYGGVGGVSFTPSGAFALAVADKRVELRASPFDTALSSMPADSTPYYEWTLTSDASFVLRIDGDRTTVYETGLLGNTPAAAGAAAPTMDVDSPPETKAELDPDAYAVVIGVEKYRQNGIPPVDFAAHDAQTMASYLTGAMGFDPKNVVLLTDAEATRTDLEKNLKWLSNRVTAKSRVFVYYAGHGSPNPETGEGYLMPYEADPSYLDETAFPIAKLYASLGKLPTQDVTVVLDACFSGQGARSLIAKGTRPLVSVVQSKAEPNTVVLAAAGSNQVSASFPEARHGLLTYYLLAGLQGRADAKHDGLITADELIAYVRPAVERAAKLQNVAQTPSLMSPPGAVPRPWIVLPPKK
jgi:hypothetical protein